MSGPDRTRLRKELEKLTDWDISGVDASPVGDDLTHLSGSLPIAMRPMTWRGNLQTRLCWPLTLGLASVPSYYVSPPGRIRGPKDTPYEGGIFGVDIQIPRDYPFAPPKMKCVRALNWPLLNGGGGHGGVAVLATEAA